MCSTSRINEENSLEMHCIYWDQVRNKMTFINKCKIGKIKEAWPLKKVLVGVGDGRNWKLLQNVIYLMSLVIATLEMSYPIKLKNMAVIQDLALERSQNMRAKKNLKIKKVKNMLLLLHFATVCKVDRVLLDKIVGHG